MRDGEVREGDRPCQPTKRFLAQGRHADATPDHHLPYDARTLVPARYRGWCRFRQDRRILKQERCAAPFPVPAAA